MAPQRLQTPPNKKIPRKFYHHFLFKALILTVFLVIIPLFPSEPPDFVAPSIFTRNWELLHLVFVGIVVSYGLFSRKNDSAADSQNNGKFDNAQSYMSKLLHVASVFDEEADASASASSFDDNNNNDDDDHVKKVQTWSSQYVRNEPMLVVADKNTAINAEKPLLLPVRSLKSRVSDEKDGEFVGKVYNRSNTSPVVVKGFSSNSRSLSRNDLIDMVHGEDSGINSRGHVRSNSSTSFKEFSGGGGEGSIGSLSFKSRVGGSNDRVFSNSNSNSEMSRSLYRSNSNDVQGNTGSGAGAGAGAGVGAGGMKSRNGGSSDRVLSNSNSDMSRSLYRLNSNDVEGNSGNGGMKSRNGGSNDRVVLNDSTRNSEEFSRSMYKSNSSLSSRGSSRNSRRRSSGSHGELDDGGVEESDGKVEESVVLPSPIPWRSRSGRLEMKGESNDSSTHLLSKISSSPPKGLSSSPKVSSPRNLSSIPTSTFESEAKSVEDFGRRKSNYSSRLPPPPPPPPPPPFQTSKRSQSSSHKGAKDTRNKPSSDTNDAFQVKFMNGGTSASVGNSVRNNRLKEGEPVENESHETNSDGYFPRQESSFSEYPKETRDFLERVLLETDDESESEGESYKEERMESTKVDAAPSEIVTDEGPDVDKKADEFIAKFREQIRLQRIESIKKSTGQLNRTSVR